MATPKTSRIPGLLAISPIVVFLAIYLLTSLLTGDFYKVPVSSAFLLASAYAFIITPGNLDSRIGVFSKGASDHNIMLMIWIFLMAGAFAGLSKEIGGIDSTVNLALSIVPLRMLLAGLFLTSCFVSMAIGTSVGTIVALVPIAAGIAEQTGIMSTGMITALVVSGAFFGDNLSFISDTTIAATRAVGCEMNEKFKANLRIVILPMLISTAIYLFMGWRLTAVPEIQDFMIVKVLPYIAVIVLAVLGCNVILVLAIGILLNAVIGFCTGALGWTDLLGAMGNGMAGMSDLIVVTLLAGGMLGLLSHNGGLEYIMNNMLRHVHGRRGAELGITMLTGTANLCTANNTIAIISVGRIVHDIAERYHIPPRRAASLMDISSCFVQGLIPYGAQLLMAAGLTGLSALDIMPYLYYQFVAGAFVLLSILLVPRH